MLTYPGVDGMMYEYGLWNWSLESDLIMFEGLAHPYSIHDTAEYGNRPSRRGYGCCMTMTDDYQRQRQ